MDGKAYLYVETEDDSKELAAVIDQSHDTALRTIQRLIAKGILKADEKGGRSQRYSLI